MWPGSPNGKSIITYGVQCVANTKIPLHIVWLFFRETLLYNRALAENYIVTAVTVCPKSWGGEADPKGAESAS